MVTNPGAGPLCGEPPSPSGASPPAGAEPGREAARAEARAADVLLIERALKGEAEGYEALFAKYREKVYRVVYGYLRDKDDALDVTQEAFIRAFRNLSSFERESGFYTWLTRIAINLSIDTRRKRSRKKTVALEDYMDPEAKVGGAGGAPDPRRGLEEKELRERYVRALDELSEKHRTVFVLHTVEGMAYKEIAVTLDISIGTVMSRLHYARKHLQDLLKGYLK